jgi:uroporphyrinogen decarboxylase
MTSSTESTPPPPQTLTRKELFLRACRSQPVPRVPVWIMRQAGRYLPEYRDIRKKHAFLEVCKTPDLAVEVSLQPYRRLGVDAVIVFSDILIPVEAMGVQLVLDDAGPQLPLPVRTPAQVEALRMFDPEQETGFLMDAIRGLCRSLGPDVPVLGFAAAPWTLACYLIEGSTRERFSTVKAFANQEPRAFHMLLEKIARATARYLKAQLAAGAAAVQLFDTWCGELDAREYAELALPATQQLIAELEAAPAPVILYSKASNHLMDSVAQAGADVLSVDWRVDLADLRRKLGPAVALQGNVDPAVLLGPAQGIRDAVREAVEKTGGAGHILNLGHGILPGTPVENAKLFVEAGQKALIAPLVLALMKSAPAQRGS